MYVCTYILSQSAEPGAAMDALVVRKAGWLVGEEACMVRGGVGWDHWLATDERTMMPSCGRHVTYSGFSRKKTASALRP
jgi:hypothetical protein